MLYKTIRRCRDGHIGRENGGASTSRLLLSLKAFHRPFPSYLCTAVSSLETGGFWILVAVHQQQLCSCSLHKSVPRLQGGAFSKQDCLHWISTGKCESWYVCVPEVCTYIALSADHRVQHAEFEVGRWADRAIPPKISKASALASEQNRPRANVQRKLLLPRHRVQSFN